MAAAKKKVVVVSASKPVEHVREREYVREETSLTSILGMIVSNFGTGLLIVAAFLIGMLWSEVKYLRKGVTTTGTTATTGTTTTTTGTTQATGGPAITTDQLTALQTTSLFFGKKDAKVAFVEVSDPSCPYCHIAGGENPELNKSAGAQFTMAKDGGTYVPPVQEIRKLVESGEASFSLLYYPGHGAGEVAMLALYCANDQGKFWEAHDLEMSAAGYTMINDTVKNDRTKIADMANFLKSAVDATELQKCMEGSKYADRLAADQAMATQLGITGTPLFFVNTTPFPGAYSFTDMQSAVASAK